MDNDKLKDEIKKIAELASSIDEKFQEKCFEILLNKHLGIATTEKTKQPPLSNNVISDTNVPNYENVIAFDGDSISILKTISDKRKSKKAVALALKYLFAKSLKGVEEVPSGEIIEVCKNHNAFDQTNFAQHLVRAKQYFIVKGKGKSKMFKLTVPGKNRAIELIQELN